MRFLRSLVTLFRTGLVLLILACLERPSRGADNIWSVQKLNDNKPWDRFIDSPIPIQIQGRIGNFGGGQFRLLRCEVRFTIDNSKLRSMAPKSTIELSGRFKKVDGKTEFAVDDLKVVAGYAEQFESRALKLKRATAEEWAELGDWVSGLSRFYDDADLLKKGTVAYSKSIDVAYESLKSSDADGRFSLAKKVDEFHLPSRRKMELIHEGLRIRWQSLQAVVPIDPAACDQFAKSLGDSLEGTTVPIPQVPRDLKESYEQEPIATYRKVSDEQRILLHRLFFVAVTRKRLLHDAATDGRDGDVIAEKIEQAIPEESALAELQRTQRLAYRVANIGKATRTEAEDLASSLRDRGQNETAQKTLLQWIKSHEIRLKGDGVVGLIQLADEYLALLNNESVAVEYLTDAYRMDPASEEVKTKLNSLGYEWRQSRWAKKLANRSEIPMPVPEQNSGITKDMTASELRQLLGQPGSLSRAITSRGITEVWSFGPAGGSRLVVRLEQKGRDKEPKVSAVSNPK